MSATANSGSPRDAVSPYASRELSWLSFVRRVLALAQTEGVPLLERVKFAGIVGMLHDDFFMKRMTGLKRLVAEHSTKRTMAGDLPLEEFENCRAELVSQVEALSCLVQEKLRPALAEANLPILDWDDLSPGQQKKMLRYFDEVVLPVLTPMVVDSEHPFPWVNNTRLNLVVSFLNSKRGRQIALIETPASLPRWCPVGRKSQFVPIEQVISANIGRLYPSADSTSVHLFRITREANGIEVRAQATGLGDEDPGGIVQHVSDGLKARRFAGVVRLETSASMPHWLRLWLQERTGADDAVDVADGYMSHHDLIQFGSMERRGLRFPNHVPAIHPRLRRVSREDPTAIFEAIASGDILLHHPYHDFESSVLHFIESAAMDPDVLAIKISVYRTNKESPIIRALVGASHRGKQVAVLMEVKARFDEAPNIEWGQRLEAEGVHVSYGVQSLKTHAKCALVVRREGKGTRQYAHLGTGNYHSGTAKLYVDLGILTADPEITADVAGLFNTLTGATVMRRFKRIIVAPRSMRRRFIGLIQREAEHAAAGRPSGIWAKMNSLQDPQIIRELYSASAAGVPITLFVRSMCCLRPGVEGLSETIRVVSVVGRFLEHSRIFRFTNGGEAELFFGSADWAKRNLNNRVEVITPVIDERVRAELEAIIDAHGRDNSSAWDIGGDGDHRLRSPASGEPVANVQSFLMSEPLGGVVDPTRREHVQPGHSSGNPRPLPSETES